MQFDNNFVFGLEGDIDYADLTKSHTSPADNFTSNWQARLPFADGMTAKVRISEVSPTLGLSYKF
jgi:hypothetical protein